MKRTKIILSVILAFILALSPLVITAVTVLVTPNVYEDTMYGALHGKLERLTKTEGEKIIVVGGSSVAFGLDSELLESYLDMPVVNFGLYAALGTKMMLDLSLAGVKSGDVVVIAPELSEQTLSLYFNSESALAAMSSDYSMMRYIKGEDRLSILGGLWAHAGDKLRLCADKPVPQGIYRKDSFNAYGDIKKGIREENVMQLYYDPTTEIELDGKIFSEDFISYLNDYAEECEARGATVYFSYCPMNSAAVIDNTDAAKKKLADFLGERLNFEIISIIDDYVYDRAYFYDTNFHLNDTGVELRTKKLAQDLLIATGNLTLINTAVAQPPLPEVDTRYFGETDENADNFIYEKLSNGAYAISGVKNSALSLDTLTLPVAYEGYKVTAILDGAFVGVGRKRIVITENSNIRNLLDGSFRDTGGATLFIYYTYTDENEKLSPPSDFFGTVVHVPKNSIYCISNYDWEDSSSGFILVDDIE